MVGAVRSRGCVVLVCACDIVVGRSTKRLGRHGVSTVDGVADRDRDRVGIANITLRAPDALVVQNPCTGFWLRGLTERGAGSHLHPWKKA